jgi:Uma2 family endonuclease
MSAEMVAPAAPTSGKLKFPSRKRRAPDSASSDDASSEDAPKNLLTADQFYRMTGIGPAELVNGEIVTRMPTGHPHGFIENIIGAFLFIYLQANRIGRALTGEVGIITKRQPYTVRAADVVFISHERLAEAQPEGYLDVAPELVIEIMSPSNSWTETQEKLADYFAIGVKMVWVVDLQLEQIHVYRSLEEIQLFRLDDELTAEEILPGFTLPLTDIFAA